MTIEINEGYGLWSMSRVHPMVSFRWLVCLLYLFYTCIFLSCITFLRAERLASTSPISSLYYSRSRNLGRWFNKCLDLVDILARRLQRSTINIAPSALHCIWIFCKKPSIERSVHCKRTEGERKKTRKKEKERTFINITRKVHQRWRHKTR